MVDVFGHIFFSFLHFSIHTRIHRKNYTQSLMRAAVWSQKRRDNRKIRNWLITWLTDKLIQLFLIKLNSNSTQLKVNSNSTQVYLTIRLAPKNVSGHKDHYYVTSLKGVMCLTVYLNKYFRSHIQRSPFVLTFIIKSQPHKHYYRFIWFYLRGNYVFQLSPKIQSITFQYLLRRNFPGMPN